jgi:hypothetical protein
VCVVAVVVVPQGDWGHHAEPGTRAGCLLGYLLFSFFCWGGRGAASERAEGDGAGRLSDSPHAHIPPSGVCRRALPGDSPHLGRGSEAGRGPRLHAVRPVTRRPEGHPPTVRGRRGRGAPASWVGGWLWLWGPLPDFSQLSARCDTLNTQPQRYPKPYIQAASP